MKCRICGRELRNEQSRELGYGPVCYRKVFGKHRPVWEGGDVLSGKETFVCEVPGQICMDDYLQELQNQ